MNTKPKNHGKRKCPNEYDTPEPSPAKKRLTSASTSEDNRSKTTIQSIPPELLVEILSMLSVCDVVAFGSTCHAFHQLTLGHWTWRRLFRRQSRDWRLRNIKTILEVLKIVISKKDREKE